MLHEDWLLLTAFTIIFQIQGLFIGLRSLNRLAAFTNAMFPLLVVYSIWTKIDPTNPLKSGSDVQLGPEVKLTLFEAVFLAVSLLSFVFSLIGLCLRKAPPPFVWMGWILNFFVCTVIVYLTFFFKSQF